MTTHRPSSFHTDSPLSGFSSLRLRMVEGASNGRQLWVLDEPLEFAASLNDAGGLAVVVPKGFVTDFASVPRFLWPVYPPMGRWGGACAAPPAVLHDYLYWLPGCSRWLADAVWREAMARQGIPFWRRVTAFWAVRLFGRAFKKRRK